MTDAANVLNAIGGAPLIDSPDIVPEFPLQLPLTNVTVDIQPFSLASVQNFMLIESTTHMVISHCALSIGNCALSAGNCARSLDSPILIDLRLGQVHWCRLRVRSFSDPGSM